ncbi:MAG: NAD(P)H-dependent oxidoreductase, partial [bacterium]|nr:NAD(P)H-dependent oxidoreductase [bacterium]
MKMKCIALSCSPSRNRNSDSMLDAFIKGMHKVEGLEVEKIYLEDIPINYYRFENKDGPEEGEDEFKKLTDKIQNSAGLVIAAPTYNFSVPAHLKNFLDRIRFFTLDFKRKTNIGQPVGKLDYLKTYFLVSGGTPRWAQIILFFAFPAFWLRGVFLYFRAEVMGAYYSGDTKTFQNQKILSKCERKGEKYAKQLSKGKRQGILERIFFRPPEQE